MSFDLTTYLKQELPSKINRKKMASSIQKELKGEVKAGKFKRRASDSPMNTSGSLYSSIGVVDNGYDNDRMSFGVSMNKYGFYQSEGYTFSLWTKNDVSALSSWLEKKGIDVNVGWFIKNKFGKWVEGTNWIDKSSSIGIKKGFELRKDARFMNQLHVAIFGNIKR